MGGAGAALLLAPTATTVGLLGPWAAISVGTGWTAAEVAGVSLMGLAGLWAFTALLRRPRWDVQPNAAGSGAAATAATDSFRDARSTDDAEAVPALKLAEPPEPKWVDDVDPAAVRSNWSASAAKADAQAKALEEDADAPATVPFPTADESTDEPAVATHSQWPEEWDDEGNEPSVIRFEDVPRTVEVGGRVVDLTEMEFEGGKEERLKGLSKKERRTVRKALRVRERMLMRAA